MQAFELAGGSDKTVAIRSTSTTTADGSPSRDEYDLRSPALLLDTAVVEKNFARIVESLPPKTKIRFATKCNPSPIILRTLARLGCSFEAASAAELGLLAGVGVEPREVLHSLPCRSIADLKACRDLGVGVWSVDSATEIEKLVKHAPASSVSVRLAVDDSASHWNLSRKFGADESAAVELIKASVESGLLVHGLSFHVGSQVTDIRAWARAMAVAGTVLDRLGGDYRPAVLNIGGGFPAPYTEGIPDIEAIGQSIASALGEFRHAVELEAEPGRFLVAEAGTVSTEVTGISTRHGRKWVFLDVGAFNGLYEASPGGGKLTYPISAAGRSSDEHDTPCVLAGPSCDGDDTIGDAVMLPFDLVVGDRLEIKCAGAYSTAYVTEFCGVPPLQVHALDTRFSQETIYVGGTDLYRVAWPGSELFERAMLLEEQWFELSGFVEADGLKGYEPYQAASTFVVVQSPEGDLLSVCRLISASARGFKTTNDFELSDEGRLAVDAVPVSQILEVGTMATHPAARGLGPTLDVMRGVIDLARRRKVTHLLTSLDAGLYEIFTGPPLYMPCRPIGEPRDYFGSLTVPGFGPLVEHEDVLRRSSPELHEYLYGAGHVRPAL